MNEYYSVVLIMISCYLGYSLFERKINRILISGPMIMLFGGMLTSHYIEPNALPDIMAPSLQLFIEVTLAIVLFTDASKSKLNVLKHSYSYPALLLGLALPLGFIMTCLLAIFLFDALNVIYILLITVILTPTDAALSQHFLNNRFIPANIREAINVESGLNDGLVVPIFSLILVALAHGVPFNTNLLIFHAFSEIGIALICALTFSPLLFKLILYSENKNLFSHHLEVYIFVPLALIIYMIVQMFGGSGFFAVFVAGLFFDFNFKKYFRPQRLSESETLAEALTMIVWFVFGLYSYNMFYQNITLNMILFALATLTIARALPVLLATAFTQISLKDKIYLAWFGPRGLASVVFLLIVLTSELAIPTIVINTITLTIILSVILHGISATLLSISKRQ